MLRLEMWVVRLKTLIYLYPQENFTIYTEIVEFLPYKRGSLDEELIQYCTMCFSGEDI